MKEEIIEESLNVGYSGSSSAIGIKEIVLSHYRRVISLACVEFRGGYYNKTTSNDLKSERETYHPDTRAIYQNAVYHLALVMFPEFDNQAEQDFNDFQKELSKIKNEFITSSKAQEEIILGEDFYNDSDKLLLENYKQKSIQLYIKLFGSLAAQLKRKNYYETEVGTFES